MNIDDDVLKIARRRASEEGRSLGELVTEALRERLVRRPVAARERYVAVTFGEGGPRPGVDITNNAGVRDLMDDA